MMRWNSFVLNELLKPWHQPSKALVFGTLREHTETLKLD